MFFENVSKWALSFLSCCPFSKHPNRGLWCGLRFLEFDEVCFIFHFKVCPIADKLLGKEELRF